MVIFAYMKKTYYSNKFLLTLLIYFSIISTQVCQVEENLVKTVFFQRFAEFTTWPGSPDIQDKSKPFIIGVFEKNSFSQLIEKTYSNKNIINKKVVVKHLSNISEANSCHIIYIPKMPESEIENILSYTKDKPILTIGDTKGYAKKGVHINLYTIDQSIRFEINETAVKKSGLHMSHLLLDFASIVKYQENK